MVVAQQDVLDAMHQVRAGDREGSRTRYDLDPRLRRVDQGCRVSAIAQLHAHEDVGDRALEAGEFDAFTGEPTGHIDHTTLDQRIRELLHMWIGDVARALRQRENDGQAHAGEHRRAPDEFVALR